MDRLWVKTIMRMAVVIAVATLLIVWGVKVSADREYVTNPLAPITVCQGQTLVLFDAVQVSKAESAYPWKFTSEKSEPFEAEVSLREFSLSSGRWILEEGRCVTIEFATDGARIAILSSSDDRSLSGALAFIGVMIAVWGCIAVFYLS